MDSGQKHTKYKACGQAINHKQCQGGAKAWGKALLWLGFSFKESAFKNVNHYKKKTQDSSSQR